MSSACLCSSSTASRLPRRCPASQRTDGHTDPRGAEPCRSKQGRAGQGKAGQGRAGQGRAGQPRPGQARPGQARARARPGQARPGQAGHIRCLSDVALRGLPAPREARAHSRRTARALRRSSAGSRPPRRSSPTRRRRPLSRPAGESPSLRPSRAGRAPLLHGGRLVESNVDVLGLTTPPIQSSQHERNGHKLCQQTSRRQVFDHYAKLDADKTHLDKKAHNNQPIQTIRQQTTVTHTYTQTVTHITNTHTHVDKKASAKPCRVARLVVCCALPRHLLCVLLVQTHSHATSHVAGDFTATTLCT